MQRLHKTLSTSSKQRQFDAKEMLTLHADEITSLIMEQAREGNTKALEMAANYSMGKPRQMKRKVHVPELVNANPLAKAGIIANLVAKGDLCLDDAQALSNMADSELESSQLRTLASFVNRISAGEEISLVAREMLPVLRNIESAPSVMQTIDDSENVVVMEEPAKVKTDLSFLE